MADSALKQKIRDALRHGTFKDEDDYVFVTDGDWDGLIHIMVVSPKFDDRRLIEKDELIFSDLEAGLSDEERSKVSLAIGHSPLELMTI